MKRIFTVIILVAMMITIGACAKKNTEASLREEDLRAVCELATLECFYNNVAKIEKKASNWFQKDREMWIEYEGVARIGVDMSQLKISISGNTITMAMPKAKILSIKPNEETLSEKSYVSSSDGWLVDNPITAEDQQEAITEGQKEMESAVLNNSGLFERAEKRAKKLIENYITQMSKVMDVEYTIVWVDA